MRYGTCELFHVSLEEQQPNTVFWHPDDNGPLGAGWFYWCCSPGCLPEGDPIGPFESKDLAVEDAIENGYIDKETAARINDSNRRIRIAGRQRGVEE